VIAQNAKRRHIKGQLALVVAKVYEWAPVGARRMLHPVQIYPPR
jgi:hypothetical protein